MIDVIIGVTLTILFWVFMVAPIIIDQLAGSFHGYSYLDCVKYGVGMTFGIVALVVLGVLVLLTLGFVFGDYDIFTTAYYKIVTQLNL